MTGATLSARALNRATLARQHLLERVRLPALDAVRLLGGLNAQDPNPPYLSLHARLDGFDRDELTGLLTDRRVVRSIFIRATQHLVAAGDFRWMRPALAPVMRRATQGAFRRAVEGIDLGELAATGRRLLAGRTMTRPELGRLLAERYPGRDRTALAWTFQYLVPVVHVPPAGTWNRTGVAPFTLAEEWLGGPLDPAPDLRELVLRYLAGFGPATVMDIQAWSGLTRLREVTDGLRPGLRVFRGEDGQELLDLPDASRPGPDTPAPVRFMPAFDNLVTGYRDRTRMMTAAQQAVVCDGAVVAPVVLVDGVVRATWALRDADLRVEPFTPLSAAERSAVQAEGERLLAFAADDADARAVRVLDT